MRKLGIQSLLIAVAVVLSGACSLDSSSGPTANPEKGRSILFVGNSLTYVNDLPAMLAALADSAHGQKLDVQSVAFPDYALEDHWSEGTALAAIRRGGWEVVILQQGSSALPESRVNLRQWTANFATEIRKTNGKPGLYMVWPTSDRQFDFQNVIDSYTLAANDVDGILFPVGAAWLAVWKRDSSVPLYAPDGLHPTIQATYLAAAVIYAKLYGKSPVGLPASLRLSSGATVSIPPAVAAILQAGAAEVTGT
jgi:hypothetical protein